MTGAATVDTCPECGSTEVDVPGWININTHQTTSEDDGASEGYCNECDEPIHLREVVPRKRTPEDPKPRSGLDPEPLLRALKSVTQTLAAVTTLLDELAIDGCVPADRRGTVDVYRKEGADALAAMRKDFGL
jgi:hypothetical protein